LGFNNNNNNNNNNIIIIIIIIIIIVNININININKNYYSIYICIYKITKIENWESTTMNLIDKA